MSVPAQPGLEASIGSLTQTTNTTNGAQSPAPSPASFAHGANGEKTFSAEDIAKARKEEKDKLYSELTSLKDQWAQAQKTLADVQKKQDEEAAELVRKEQEKEAKAKLKREEEMSAKALLEAKLRETNDTWEQRFTQLQQERDQEKALLAKENQYRELVDYRNSRLNELAEEIAPQFHNFIAGDSREQIDAAIEQAKVATQSIWSEVQQATQQAPAQGPRGVSPTGYSPFGPLDTATGTQTFTAKDINNMTMSEYAEFRQKSGLASGEASRNRGLFG